MTKIRLGYFIVFISILSVLPFNCISQDFDIIIENGRVIDGTGNPWYNADIGIKNGKIAQIGDLSPKTGITIINAEGEYVCPGFIDVHTHLEGSLPQRPGCPNYIHDGVTTVITGNCGGSSIPLESFFSKKFKNGIAVNIGSLVGHNSTRRLAMGTANRAASPEEMILMKEIVEKEMKAGAFGLSTGLIYVPGTYAPTEEVVELAKVVADFGGIYVSHIRNENNEVIDAIHEACNIGIQAQIPVQISHFKVSGKTNWGESSNTVKLIEDYRKKGLDVTVDQYPYTASSTKLAVLLPNWVLADGIDSIRARIDDPARRNEIKEEMKKELDERSGFPNYAYAVVANCPWNSSFNGKSISEINLMLGKSETFDDEAETVLDMVHHGQRVQMVYHKMTEEDVERIIKVPFSMVASDSGVPAFDVGAPHPRAYGTNVRVISKYVKERQIINLEEAIRKMTSFPASRFNIKNRGLIKEGMAADLLVFNLEEMKDKAEFTNPHAYSEGINHVIVNGIIVLEGGSQLEHLPGEFLYGPGKQNN